MRQSSKISVIVPVYKAEKFLHRCVDSILSQTYANFNVILVDDGSPDRCGDICDAYAQKDARVIVIHQENRGPAQARAAGVAVAKDCVYIAFVDSDDTLDPKALEVLAYYAKDDYDIIVADYDRNDKRYSDQELEVVEFVNQMYLYKITPSPCARLYRRALFSEATFDLPRHFIMGEDFVMNLRLAFASQKKIRLLPTIVYYYSNNADSTMNTFNYTQDYLAQSYKFKQQAIPEAYRKECMPYCIANVLQANHIIMRHYYTERVWKRTPLHQQILDDIRIYGCKGLWWERFSLNFSNPVYSALYIGVLGVVRALKRIKRKVLL